MEKESCQNCEHNSACLIKGALIFGLYIQTGRSRELPADKTNVNVRRLCEKYSRTE